MYETEPVDFKEQRAFLNLVVEAQTELFPMMLLSRVQKIELQLGRRRTGPPRGPRTIDIDLIAYDDLALDEPDLILPHPRLFERAFVLAPLAEIAPDRVIAGRKIKDALAAIDAAGIDRLPRKA